MKITDPSDSPAPQPRYDLFVFGDSLSDTGNFFRATAGLFPPSPPYSNGRFTNGPVAVEFLAEQLGLPLDPSTNFAVGGAQTGRTNSVAPSILNLGGLQDQIDRFKPQAATLGAGAEDLYVVWAGSNDFLQQLPDPTAAINTAVTNIATAVTNLIQTGAKNIVVAKTPNLGRVPQSLQAGALAALTAVSNTFNAGLESTLTGLEASTGANIILTDLFSVGENIAQNPAAFGFTNSTSAFLNGIVPANPAADPNQFFFWDQVHPTTRGHSLFADQFRNSVISGITDNITRSGSQNADKLVSFSGNDQLTGLAGIDILEGNAGRDLLHGGSQADTLIGGSSNDTLIGGGGADELTGGLGLDRFIYHNSAHGRDLITDFQVGRDKIDLSGIFNGQDYARGDKFAAYVRLAPAGAATTVRIDANGDAAGGFTALAQLANVSANSLNASSFQVR